MTRAQFLRRAAGAVVGGGALLGGVGAVQALAGPDDDKGKSKPDTKALEVTMVKDLTGEGITDAYGMAATDLGIPVKTPDGRLLFVFGDTWVDKPIGNEWRAPVGLYSTTTDLAQGITWSGAVGGDYARQFWEYEHDNPEFSTVLPSDVVAIGDTLYLHVAVQKPYPNVVWTEIWRSRDNGETWQLTPAVWGKEGTPGLHELFQMVTFGLGDDGWIYIYSTKFDRTGPIIMHRVRAEDIENPTAYQPWGYYEGEGWRWGSWGDRVDPIREGAYGELCLRPIDGKWLLTCLNLDAGGEVAIEAYVLPTPDADLAHAQGQKLIRNVDWSENNPEAGLVSQPYGGYIIPGSTLSDLHISVSQWENPDNTPDDWCYHVMQYRVRGLV